MRRLRLITNPDSRQETIARPLGSGTATILIVPGEMALVMVPAWLSTNLVRPKKSGFTTIVSPAFFVVRFTVIKANVPFGTSVELGVMLKFITEAPVGNTGFVVMLASNGLVTLPIAGFVSHIDWSIENEDISAVSVPPPATPPSFKPMAIVILAMASGPEIKTGTIKLGVPAATFWSATERVMAACECGARQSNTPRAEKKFLTATLFASIQG